mmetsp:Transcript_70057/g.200766  ORF Transcript_70057/g.200766 Transcript_70057/m.200766 type:complete len:531 (+) Transcript_70057:84-1676(+)
MASGMESPRSPLSNSKKEGEVWPVWKLVLIALPQLSVQVLWGFIGPHSAPYMQHLGAGAVLATLNNVAGPITGFFTGPIVGATSDSLTSKFGRRRPVILTGLVSLWIAGMLFAGAEHIFPLNQCGAMGPAAVLEGNGANATKATNAPRRLSEAEPDVVPCTALFFAAPMYWVMDVTINILQTPHRALVADLASPHQQVPMQVVFVFMMSIGNFVAFSIMQIYEKPVDHMIELMFGICLLNTVCVAIQFSVARERPLNKADAPKQSCCSPVLNVAEAVKHSPCLLYQLAGVQCLVWIGNTAWNLYSAQWFTKAVFQGAEHAGKGTEEYNNYVEGNAAFSFGGQMKSVLQLISTLVIMAILLKTTIRPRLVYAPCIFIGTVVSLLAAFVVGHAGGFAKLCLIFSIMPETGSFAIPFGLVATLNARAAQEGKVVSTALQMALLNCCVTVGQQICTMILAVIESQMSLEKALPLVFMVAAVAQGFGGLGALFLNDAPPDAPLGEDSEETEADAEEETEVDAGNSGEANTRAQEA